MVYSAEWMGKNMAGIWNLVYFWQTASFQDVLSDAEILALMVGCLCHDLDHRGTNNAFQAK